MSISGASAGLPAITDSFRQLGLGYINPKIEREAILGGGVSGTVWRGYITPPPEENADGTTSPVTAKSCAIKVFKRTPAYDFEQECRTYKKFDGSHPNFLEFYHAEESPEAQLVLSMFEGKDLFQAVIHPDVPFASLLRIAQISKQLLSAVAFLGELDVLHGDLKPENILINHEDQIKVVDFGNSSNLEEGLCTHTLCSRDYASPEAVLGIPHGNDADVWSLGAIVYELCTKKILFNIYSTLKERIEATEDEITECEEYIEELNETINASKELGECLDRDRRKELLEMKADFEADPARYFTSLREVEEKI